MLKATKTNTGQWRLFKEFCFEDTGIMDATEAVVLWCNQNLPHGCKFEDFADPAGRQRDATKRSPADYMAEKAAEYGHDIFLINGIQTYKVRRESVANRLNKVVNGEPAILIDPSKCKGCAECVSVCGDEALEMIPKSEQVMRDIRKSHRFFKEVGPSDETYVNDNLLIERLWRTVKNEEEYLKAYQDGRDSRISLGNYFRFYNTERPHQSHGYLTPAEVYCTTRIELTMGGIITIEDSGT